MCGWTFLWEQQNYIMEERDIDIFLLFDDWFTDPSLTAAELFYSGVRANEGADVLRASMLVTWLGIRFHYVLVVGGDGGRIVIHVPANTPGTAGVLFISTQFRHTHANGLLSSANHVRRPDRLRSICTRFDQPQTALRLTTLAPVLSWSLNHYSQLW